MTYNGIHHIIEEDLPAITAQFIVPTMLYATKSSPELSISNSKKAVLLLI